MMPEGGRDRLAKLFYYPVFADGERRASLGTLSMDVAVADHERHHSRSKSHSPAIRENGKSKVLSKPHGNIGQC